MSLNKLNCKGMSLVEVMIALTILMVVFMGLIQASILSIDVTTRNDVRDEATRLVTEAMAIERSRGYDAISSSGATTRTRKVRLFDQAYIVTTTVGTFTNYKTVQINVAYEFKGDANTVTARTVVVKP